MGYKDGRGRQGLRLGTKLKFLVENSKYQSSNDDQSSLKSN